jgi:two-component system nitrogen regulation sensor histidine kinase GlnL
MNDDSPSPVRDLQRVLDAVIDGVIVVSPEGDVDRINDEACRMLETSEESHLGRPLAELVGAAHPMLALAAEVRRSRRPMVEDDVPLERRFGNDLEVDLAISPLLDGPTREPGVVVVLRDRTIGNSLREEVSQREKLASYGHIAAGIAHEVKNPLGGIRGAAELLQLRAEDDRTRRTADLIVREVDRITSLVDELMVFAKGEKLTFAPLNLHRLLDQVLELVEADPEAVNVRFDRVFDPSIPELVGDADRLTQVFLNLVRNAIQAMGEHGGTLRITTHMAIANRLMSANGRTLPTVEVIFEDDGPGIAPEILDRLATPFFTTKSSGTGLGLAVSRHWVTAHGGRLRIRSAAAQGARVIVALPLEASPPAGTSTPTTHDTKESKR